MPAMVSMRKLCYYEQALADNPVIQALNNIAVIYHYQGEKLKEAGNRGSGGLV